MAFYKDGEAIEGAGRIFGGPTLTIDDVKELDALIALVQDVGSDGLSRVAAWFSRFDEWLAWCGENGEKPQFRASERSFRLGPRHPDHLNDIERFEISLVCARDMASRLTDNDSQRVRLVVSVSATAGLSYEGDNSGVFLRDGSIEPLLVAAAVGAAAPCIARLGAWAVGFIRIGLLPTIQAEQLVESLRTAALARAQIQELPSLSTLDPLEVRKAKGVLLLLHGVFSTDAGTFDGFINKWWIAPPDGDASFHTLKMRWLEKHPQRESEYSGLTNEVCRNALAEACSDYLIAGWPHDTLTGISCCNCLRNVALRFALDGEPNSRHSTLMHYSNGWTITVARRPWSAFMMRVFNCLAS